MGLGGEGRMRLGISALLVVGDDSGLGFLDDHFLFDDDDFFLFCGSVFTMRLDGGDLGFGSCGHLGLLDEICLLFLRAFAVIRHKLPLRFLIVLVLKT